jgi:hypothetical protein
MGKACRLSVVGGIKGLMRKLRRLSARISVRTRSLIGKPSRRNCLAVRHGTQLRVSHRRQPSWHTAHEVDAGAVRAITVTRP